MGRRRLAGWISPTAHSQLHGCQIFLLAFTGGIWDNTRLFSEGEIAPVSSGCGRTDGEWRVKMCMLDEIRAKRDEIYAIARKHKAEGLWVFGSCARKEAVA